jgi:hypothetical protein
MGHFGRTHCGRTRIGAFLPGESRPPEPAAEPTHEEIARLAHSYWESRGRQGGSPEADWLRAEAELRGQGA